MRKTSFGVVGDRAVDLYTLSNASGMEVAISNYGATIVSIKTPDRHGAIANVVLGFDSLNEYLGKQPYFGATVGRYANRIAQGKVVLDGVEYNLTRNENENHLHGGARGFDKVVWDVKSLSQNRHGTSSGFRKQGTDAVFEIGSKAVSSDEEPTVVLHYLSKDGEEGYPGNLDVTVAYTLTAESELKIDYRATTDKPTVVNLTNHSYFNLAGEGHGDVLGHRLTIDADRFTPVVKGHIPTGEVRSVRGTPLDFATPTAIGLRIEEENEFLKLSSGYGLNYVLNKFGCEMTLAARVVEPTSGRVMEVFTTEPAIQFYTANRLDGSLVGRSGKPYGPRCAFCLEPQHSPDSPNHPNFPSTELRPGQQYHSTSCFRFAVE